jgi:hypothetical protein
MWDELTTEHKRYAALAVLVGALLGAVGGTIAVILLFAGCAGAFGIGLGITIKLSGSKEDKWYASYMIVAICSIVVGLVCFAVAVVGLYFHQQGVI